MHAATLCLGDQHPLLVVLSGCSSSAPDDAGASPVATEPAVVSEVNRDAAEEQAQAWLVAAALPPDAIRASAATGAFHSYQAWPCQPVATLEAFWTVPYATVAETANWLMANPTADLVSTGVGPVPEDAGIDEVNVGYIPADGSQQGVVYTVAKRNDGVAVRAQIAALTDSSVCPSLPPGTSLGKPGQG